MSGASCCAPYHGAVYYALQDLGDAKHKFMRRQNADTHARLLAAKEKVRVRREALDAHLAECDAEVSA